VAAPPTETDRLVLKDGATLLNAPQSLVPHTLDRGMLQFAKITMCENSSISLNTCLNLHSSVGEGSVVGASSVLMKAEMIPAHAYAEGNPSMLSGAPPTSFVPEDTDNGGCGSWRGTCFRCAQGCQTQLSYCLRCNGKPDEASNEDSVLVPLFDASQPVYGTPQEKDQDALLHYK